MNRERRAPDGGLRPTGTPLSPTASGRGPDRPVWVNGRLVSAREAALPLLDRGARDGEGLFETLRVYRGRPFLWERHLERLVVSAAELGFPVPPSPSLLRQAFEELLAACALEDAVVRLTLTRGAPGGRPVRSGAWMELEPIEARLWRGTRRGAAMAVFSRVAFEPGPWGRYKTTSRLGYHLVRDQARQTGADEALLASARGELFEGSTSNLFLVREGRLLTPPESRGVLPGIVRAWVLARCARLGIAAAEAILGRADLEGAEEAFLTNSVQEIVPLAQVEGRVIPPGNRGPRLAELYRAEADAR